MVIRTTALDHAQRLHMLHNLHVSCELFTNTNISGTRQAMALGQSRYALTVEALWYVARVTSDS